MMLASALLFISCGTPGQPSKSPATADTNPNPAGLDPGRMVGAANTSAANTEASSLKAAARIYISEKPALTRLTSDDLAGLYTGKPRARYYFNPTSLTVTRVDSMAGGWPNIVFSLANQKWVKGTPDNDHPDDQDIP